ncbi:MAG TPA: hypothetical protein VN809_06395, partial [Telmatospirillum sp.]|nr:hypothetical protein [Telmatospirillum sp.]
MERQNIGTIAAHGTIRHVAAKARHRLRNLPLIGLLVSTLPVAPAMGAGADMSKAGPPSACATLAGLIDAAPAGPVFLASFPTVTDGPLHAAAFLYDNAAAAIALVGCGQAQKARPIGDAILAALTHDRFWHDGRLRNGYAAGPVGDGPIKLSGWWDNGRQQWFEDRYQVGSDNGNMAWAMLALLALDRAVGGADYRAGAERIGHWIVTWRDRRGDGGFTGGTFGHEPKPDT